MESNAGRTVGIGDISVYVPAPAIGLETLIEQRVMHNPGLKRHMERARRVTGQEVIRFPEMWEDTATLAATAVNALITDDPGLDLRTVRHLAVGTETGVDHSKP